MKSAQLARKARTAPTRAAAARKKITSDRPILTTALAKLRTGRVDVRKRLVGLGTEGARWLKKHPGRAVLGACAGAFALGVTVTKVARRS
jgi:hypothetical protein